MHDINRVINPGNSLNPDDCKTDCPSDKKANISITMDEKTGYSHRDGL